MEQRTVADDLADDLAEEVRNSCLGMRVSRLHRVVARVYEQELQTAGLSLPQMEILTVLVSAAGPVRQAALAAKLRAERSTVSRNLALMQKRGWVTVAETSPTGRAMSVTITGTGVAAFTCANTAWRSAQTTAARILGADAVSVLDEWLDLHPEIVSGSDSDSCRTT
jgi:DNA-binding MarR family transcriptional regulator